MEVAFGVLGSVTAWDGAGDVIALRGPRHRAVLARLLVARRRVVPVGRLVEDLWEGREEPPADAVGAVRTFVAALRRALEPERPPRAPAQLLVTEGPGYALRAGPDAVDAWRFERAVTTAGTLPETRALAGLEEALGWWRGPAYADFAAETWARTERSRLAELRLHAVERRAEAQLALGRAAEAVPDLDAHTAEHPWRENAWRLLALSLYRTGRQGDALAVLRRARTLLVEQLGTDPGPALRRLEADILAQAPHLDPGLEGLEEGVRAAGGPQERVWAREGGDPQRRERGQVDGGPQERAQSQAEVGPPEPARAHGDGDPRGQGRAQTDGGSQERRRAQPDGGSPQPARAQADGRPSARTRAQADGNPAERTPWQADSGPAEHVWAAATAAYDRTVAAGARVRLESAVGLLRDLAVTGGGGLEAARGHRLAAIAAATELGDPELTARVIGAYDVPAIWTRVDDPRLAAETVAAAERTLAALPPDAQLAVRARLLATVALESRGTRSARGPQAARQAEGIARRLNDPALLVFALNGVFMQTFQRAGLAPQRDGIGAELVAISARHGLVTHEVLGHLIRLQARSALADFSGASRHAAAAEQLAERHELPLVGVFTQWYRVLRLAESGSARPKDVEAAYRDAALRLDGAGMPGLEHGLLPLALLCLRVRRGRPAQTEDHIDWGPYEPWARPLVSLAQGRADDVRAALRSLPEPPRDLLFEALWCLAARAALAVGDRDTMERARDELAPAAAELAGAGSGLLTLGPVARYLDELAGALRSPR
ncbi:DNA-binding transcriptional activator of the SARP family [Streptomyces sp. 3213]|uniref:AfsR/SARP family transcriptional regulator n=1 Tax=Streptomyces sp. 3213.3 TaxID=1855348 RepID=UPI000896EFDD|nr:BTAD domain-containing putative transcriptional regulator [Streptomyces sp. 3213.3]SEC90225.1 DNA-binding transcriptional activator of the SARP family [Streptomyces sp. 3213] [Streptomyces sp. 3213.3]